MRLLWRARRRLLPPGPGRHRLAGRRVVCACHGRDLTEMPDRDVLALHPLPVPHAFVTWTPDGVVPLHDDHTERPARPAG